MQLGSAVVVLLLAALLLGLAHLLLLPPFEGFDETAHYSRLREVSATTGPAPQLREARMAQQVEAYEQTGPRSYASVSPFDDNGGLTYRQYAASGNARALAVPLSRREAFAPGTAENWQAQHPVLPYRLLGWISDRLGLGLQADLLLLRATCYLAAWLALLVAVLANARFGAGAMLATAGWPLLFPMWFPEMARLGNDAFVALLLSLLWLMLVSAQRGAVLRGAGLGLLLGLGLLVKAFFLPVAAGVVLVLLWSGQQRNLPLFVALLAGIALPLLLQALAGTGQSLMALFDLNDLRQAHGIGTFTTADILLLPFTIAASAFKSFLWGGTWSLARPHSAAYLPLLLLCGLVAIGLWRDRVWRRSPDRTALLLLAPFLLGLLVHGMMLALTQGIRSVPGWYLHVFAAPLGLLLARGLAALPATAIWRGLTALAVAGATLFGLVMAYLQTMLFAGCVDLAADSNRYRIPAGGCLDVIDALPQRLGILAYPGTALLCFALGACLIAASMLWLADRWRPMLSFSRKEAA